ncbi:hypothetical protein FHS01_000637 [Longimicrobium terrae]|uniref:Uncharacterized protein n=1 Tax=Longimicrobium terrae TaxID=1639882 RepID=A0A841GQL6_9BACT|nr:hypothetical protein [Longimicrobium terrae]MBB6068479.1 hypothetical protein [Longimicrobium terrae]
MQRVTQPSPIQPSTLLRVSLTLSSGCACEVAWGIAEPGTIGFGAGGSGQAVGCCLPTGAVRERSRLATQGQGCGGGAQDFCRQRPRRPDPAQLIARRVAVEPHSRLHHGTVIPVQLGTAAQVQLSRPPWRHLPLGAWLSMEILGDRFSDGPGERTRQARVDKPRRALRCDEISPEGERVGAREPERVRAPAGLHADYGIHEHYDRAVSAKAALRVLEREPHVSHAFGVPGLLGFGESAAGGKYAMTVGRSTATRAVVSATALRAGSGLAGRSARVARDSAPPPHAAKPIAMTVIPARRMTTCRASVGA